MGEFVAAKRRFVVHLRAEDVHEAFVRSGEEQRPGERSGESRDDPAAGRPSPAAGRPSLDVVVAALDQLVEWGNLRADPDTGRVSTVEDFHRARFLYQLTHEGESAERALSVYDEQLGRRGALQAVALADIASHLRALRELSADEQPDPGRVAAALRDLLARSTDLAENAQAFMGSLQRTIDLYDADVEAFTAYKDNLIAYLERFIKDLITIGAEIAGLLLEMAEADVSRLLAIAARRDAEDAAPGGEGAESEGPESEGRRKSEADERLAEWQERWRGLREWFVSDRGHPCQAQLLRSRARQAIPQLLAVVSSLNERRSGRSDRSADFRTLALWFAQAPTEEAMHRLWRCAFGVYSSRHLTIDGETLAARDEAPVPAATSWLQAPPLQISPRLRRTGSYERRGSPSRIESREQARRLLAERVAREAEQTAAARARLATGVETSLRDLGELDRDSFSLFLALLGEALSARRWGEREASVTTADGTMQVRLATLPDASQIELLTPAGIFRGPDHTIEIVDLAAGSGA